MAKWSAHQTCNVVVMGSSLAVWLLAGFVLDRPQLKSLATLVNSHLVASCQLGCLILSCRISIICF